MKILLFGAEGQVGQAVYERLKKIEDVIAIDRSLCDLRNEEAIKSCVVSAKPDLIVNAAAYTDVDLAEEQRDEAFAVNAIAPGIIAKQAHLFAIPLIHFSTEAVFDGKKEGAYNEDDVMHPLSVYGKSKCEGESLVRLFQSKHFILRTSWVFSSHGNNFIKKIIKLALEQDSLSVIDNQYGAPTSAKWIAEVVAFIVGKMKLNDVKDLYGTYHITLDGHISWWDYAQYVLKILHELNITTKLTSDHIIPVSLSDYPQKALRPLHSKLDISKAKKTFMLEFPHWKKEVKQAIHLIRQS